MDNSEPTGSSSDSAKEIFEEKKAAIGTCLDKAYPAKKHLIPADWSPPPVSELPPRSKACAEQWTDASYQTEAEGFLLYWRTERKMKTDWRDTWANRIIARHSAVMRDQKFGNAPVDIVERRNLTPAEQEEFAERMAQRLEAEGKHVEAQQYRARCKAKAA